jgi:hypothetical protein
MEVSGSRNYSHLGRRPVPLNMAKWLQKGTSDLLMNLSQYIAERFTFHTAADIMSKGTVA